MNGRVVTEMGEASVKETDKSYVMELAAPGIKKEYCRIGINDEGNLTMPKTEPKEKVTKAIEVS